MSVNFCRICIFHPHKDLLQCRTLFVYLGLMCELLQVFVWCAVSISIVFGGAVSQTCSRFSNSRRFLSNLCTCYYQTMEVKYLHTAFFQMVQQKIWGEMNKMQIPLPMKSLIEWTHDDDSGALEKHSYLFYTTISCKSFRECRKSFRDYATSNLQVSTVVSRIICDSKFIIFFLFQICSDIHCLGLEG